MTDVDWGDEDRPGRGGQPGADVGDDLDVPEDPLLGPPSEDEPADVAGGGETTEDWDDDDAA
jgi:hypothetical protein